MIAHYIKKKDLITLFESDSILRLYDSFLKNESIKYVAVVDKAGRPKGLIYRNNLPSMSNTASVADFLAKQMVTVGTDTKIEEVDRILFQLAKKNINEIVAVNKEGVLEGIYEKIIRECSDFYEKYAFIKREGYSLSDWFHHYYGENAVIGIHSYSEYTVLLLDGLRDSGMEVKFICQSGGNSRGAWGKFLEKPFSEISEEELKECDIVVNAFLSLKEQVHYLYKQYKKYDKVINLYDIVDELYHYERDAGYMIRIANIIARGGRKVYLFDYPVLSEQTIRSERENILLREHWNTPKVREKIQAHDPGKYSELENLLMPSLNKARKKYGKKEVSFSDIKSYFPSFSEKSNAHIKYVGESCMIYDMKSLYVNIKNGMRISLLPNGEEKAGSQTKIHFFGKSWVYGYHSSDEFTIPSFVQRISNEKKLGFHVYNHGIPGLREDRIANMMYEWDNRVPKDDIFVLIHMFGDYGNSYNKKVALEYDYIEPLSSDRPHDYGEIWMDSGHIGEDGNELLAKQVIDYIENGKTAPGIFKNKFNTTAGRKVYRYEKMDRASLWAEIPEFRKYQEYLSSHRQKNGSIVMNCNPFTLGHRYLIETAASKCEKLYIFVVEEDKSIFPFSDRLKLVEEGVKDLKNVIVLHSGKFIISALTFPGYFNKSVDNNVQVDTSDDLILFAKYIAPTLGITVRFAGEEPLDYITRQYNESMREILPQYGITFEEISRKKMGDSVISASRIRALLKEGNFDEISKMVPQTTLRYLMENQEKYR